jgi:hypothetical protein
MIVMTVRRLTVKHKAIEREREKERETNEINYIPLIICRRFLSVLVKRAEYTKIMT